jgi:hypothetical protein
MGIRSAARSLLLASAFLLSWATPVVAAGQRPITLIVPADPISPVAPQVSGGFRQVAPYPSDDRFYCVRANPSCARDPWWAEWNELQDPQLVQFSASGLVAEARFIEAVNLLWQWTEGRALIGEAARHGVVIRAGTFPNHEGVIGAYNSGQRLVLVNPAFVETSTWMVADVLAHELRHAADHRSGTLVRATARDCFAGETRAYQSEQRFLRWLVRDLVRQPIPMQLIRQRLSSADQTLAFNLLRISDAADVGQLVRSDYAESCARYP